MKKIISFLAVILVSFTAQAQKESYNWVFGYGAGLTWKSPTRTDNTLTPVSGTGASGTKLKDLPNKLTSSLGTWEGCFSLSDSNGNLLFYSDGVDVYDKNNNKMPNGSELSGGNSSTQSGIIFPYPGAANKYVAVTLGAFYQDPAPVLRYSVIDMTMNGRLGDVVPTQKNLEFPNASAGSFSEHVTSIKIPNSQDFWVISIAKGNVPSYINAWRFSSSGIAINPAKTAIPTGKSYSDTEYGYLKISPDGKHFVWVAGKYSGVSSLVYGDFDINTGLFTNIKSGDIGNSYGVEFSPDQSLVYVTNNGNITVYKANELFSKPSLSSVTQKTYNSITKTITAIQLGPDKRIYANVANLTDQSYPTGDQMLIIDDPDNFNSPKMYKTASGFVGTTGIGLPSFAANWFDMTPTAKKFACTGYDYKFTTNIDMSGTDAPTKLSINYGDGNTGTINLTAGQSNYNIAHTYVTAGTYTVTITPVKSDNSTLSPSTVSAVVVDCSIKTNRMIRVDLQNTNTATGQ